MYIVDLNVSWWREQHGKDIFIEMCLFLLIKKNYGHTLPSLIVGGSLINRGIVSQPEIGNFVILGDGNKKSVRYL